MNRFCIAIVIVILPGASDATVFASPAYFQSDSAEIRSTVGRILDSPEFRHFQRLGTENPLDGKATNGRTGSSQGGGAGRSGKGGGAQNGREGDPQAGDGNFAEDQSSGSEGSTDDSSDFGSGSLGSGIGSALGGALHGLAWVFLGAVCVLIVFLIVKAILDYERPEKVAAEGGDLSQVADEEPQQAPGGLPADAYLTRAGELAAEGRFREAVAQLLLGAMSYIERAGLITYRRGLTHRDYVRAVREKANVYSAMRSMVRIYEPLGFGRREATKNHFEQTLNSYESGFRETSPVVEK